jgi:hypothetical protein
MDVYIALVHFPVLNKHGEQVATAVTNLDIHDLARTARTFGVTGYTIVTPVAQQQSLVTRIVRHWNEGEGTNYNPLRSEAFRIVDVAPDIESVINSIEKRTGERPMTVVTGAQLQEKCISYGDLRERLQTQSGSCLILFGTGWGLVGEWIEGCDYRLPGINAASPENTYNHLSVRAAVAVILDRLLGQRDLES